MPTRTKHEVVRSLAEDLEQEQINLHAILTSLDEAQWSRPTQMVIVACPARRTAGEHQGRRV